MVRDELQITSALSTSGEVPKCERIHLNEYQNIGELITDVDDYIEFYNYRRFHQTLDYRNPMNVYQKKYKIEPRKEEDRLDVLYKEF
jgi:transposase InsO family protein